jgi:mono/diheme cytochrome c family protein
MTPKKVGKTVLAVAAIAATVLAGMLITSPRVRANEDDSNESRIQQGFEIAPVPLNLAGKNRALVGLGSYLVNAVGICNACHNSGPGDNEFAPGGNPFFGKPKKINPATYLGGGRDFGPLVVAGSVVAGSAHIISRNLTPDKTGLPEGGRSFAEFLQIMRTGVDLDNLHPTCPTGTINTNCVPPPFDGALLQVMPWFAHQGMTDHDLRAIYEYLSAIPCIEGPPAPSVLHNDCK